MHLIRRTVLAGLLVTGAAQTADAGVRRVLVSIEGVAVPHGMPLRAFEVRTWGVEILSVCRWPRDWSVRAQTFSNPEGVVAGEADVHGARVDRLPNLFLADVRDHQPDPRPNHPASLEGWVEVARGDADAPKRTPLKAANFRLADARRCPDPPPAASE